jgi:hypothetical protein
MGNIWVPLVLKKGKANKKCVLNFPCIRANFQQGVHFTLHKAPEEYSPQVPPLSLKFPSRLPSLILIANLLYKL